MKKFLTVLLALSVVFTYSFSAVGTAFAADRTDTQYLADLAKAEQQVLSDLAGEYALAKAQVIHDGDKTYTDGTYVIAGAEWLKQLDVLYADTQKAIKAHTVSLQTTNAFNENKDDSIVLTTKYDDVTKDSAALLTALYAANESYAFNAAKAQFATDKAQYIAAANSVDRSIYSTTEQKEAYKEIKEINVAANKNPKAYADAIVAGVVAKINAVVIEKTAAAASDVATQYTNIKTMFDKYIDKAAEKYIIKEGADDTATPVPNILSLIEEQNANAQIAANKAALKADLASKIATAAQDEEVIGYTAEADKYAAWCKARDAYNEVMTYLIENGKISTVKPFPDITVTKDAATGAYVAIEGKTEDTKTNYQAVVAAVEKIKADAAAKKAKTYSDGKPMYDAELVDKALKDAVDAEYAKYEEKEYKPTTEISVPVLDYDTSFEKLHAKAVIDSKVKAEEMEYNNVPFYAVEWAKVIEAVNAAKAAIDAAETKADIEKVTKEVDGILDIAIKKIQTKANINDLFGSAGALQDAADAIYDDLSAYVNYINANKDSDDQITTPFEGKSDLYGWLAEKGARTVAEVKALYNEAKAEIDKTPTNGQKAADRTAAIAAVKALIDVLPSPLTAKVDATDAALAAKKAYEKLAPKGEAIAELTTEKTKLDNVIDAIAKLYDAEINTKYDEASKDGIDAADAPIFDEIEKLNDIYKSLKGNDSTNYANVATAKATLKTAELNAVVEAINAIPAAVTLGDKAVVEAARKAYDAYVAKYTDYTDPVNGNAAAKVTNFSALLMAEAMIKALDVNAVESLKVKASSKAVKGKITVKWTVKGDASGIDGYRVYKSKKANSGYKFMGKTKKLSMANKKDLKKGTRYFYKVRAYKVVDGKTYYSDYSNKANRIAK